MTNAGKLKRKLLFFKIKWHLVIITASFLGAVILGKSFELLLFFCCYAGLRYEFPKTYHHNNFYKCVQISIFMMIINAFITISVKHSLLFGVITGLATTYILYKIKCYEEYRDYNHLKTKFNIKSCSENELISRCREKGFNSQNTEICVKMFVDKLSAKELSKIMHIEPQSVYNKKVQFKAKLTQCD